jgi:hypothetical protein
MHVLTLAHLSPKYKELVAKKELGNWLALTGRMYMRVTIKPVTAISAWILLVSFCPSVQAQTTTPALTGEQVVDRVAPSVALILVGNDAGETTGIGSAVIVRPGGVLLTAYHGVKKAKGVQVRLNSGEIYDQVQLIGADERRDIAALRIPAVNLPAVATVDSAELKPGASVFVVSNGAALPWTASSGVFSSFRLADEVSGAGNGYRLLQFKASISSGSSSGVLVDTQGRALGIIVATLDRAQDANFAVPLDAVLGLAALPGGTPFSSGASLKLSSQSTPLTSSGLQQPQVSTAAVPTQQPLDRLQAPDTANSQPLESRDPVTILRNFRTIYVDSETMYLKPDLMTTAIYDKKEFLAWGISIVGRRDLADVVLHVDRVAGTEDYTWELRHVNTSITIQSGKVRAATAWLWMSGNKGSRLIAEELIKLIRATGRNASSPEAAKSEAKKEKK